MAKKENNEIELNGVVYIPKEQSTVKPINDTVMEWMGEKFVRADSVKGLMAPALDGKPYVIIRTYSAGVHAGYLSSRTGKEVKLINARRIWYWDGAASLSQLATDGVSKPQNCKFSLVVDSIELMEAIEVIPCTEKAMLNIQKVAIWKQ